MIGIAHKGFENCTETITYLDVAAIIGFTGDSGALNNPAKFKALGRSHASLI